jgi:hypothetical protein
MFFFSFWVKKNENQGTSSPGYFKTHQGLSIKFVQKVVPKTQKGLTGLMKKKNWQRIDGYLCFQSF